MVKRAFQPHVIILAAFISSREWNTGCGHHFLANCCSAPPLPLVQAAAPAKERGEASPDPRRCSTTAQHIDIAPHYKTLRGIALYYKTLHYIVLHFLTLHGINYMTLHYMTWHYNTLHDMALPCTTLHDMALHYMTCITCIHAESDRRLRQVGSRCITLR